MDENRYSMAIVDLASLMSRHLDEGTKPEEFIMAMEITKFNAMSIMYEHTKDYKNKMFDGTIDWFNKFVKK